MSLYRWKVNGLHHVDAQTAGEELERLMDEDRNISPERVVDASRSEDAVLHKEFEWDDEKAAEKFRVEQARSLIRNITVTVTSEKSENPVETRAFVHISPAYRPIEAVIKSPSEMEVLMAQALRDMDNFRRKYSVLKYLEPVCEEMSRTEKKIRAEISGESHEICT